MSRPRVRRHTPLVARVTISNPLIRYIRDPLDALANCTCGSRHRTKRIAALCRSWRRMVLTMSFGEVPAGWFP